MRRAYSQFLDNALLQAQTQGTYLDTYGAQISMIDNLLADPTSGLSPALQAFFSGVQDVASNPASIPSRQQLLSQGDALVARFQGFSARLTEMRYGVNRQLSDTVNEINTLAGNIARVNQQIMQLQTGDSRQANDLLDQRTALLTDLNKLVRASVVEQSDGSINVFIGNGQSLVLGTADLLVGRGAFRRRPAGLCSVLSCRAVRAWSCNRRSLRGGTLGGLLAFRSETLDVAQNQLGRVATVLAQTFNDQHRLGQDLNGVLGQDFFDVPAAAVVANQNNAGSAVIAAANSDVGALTGSDYRLQLAGGTWTLTRLSDGNQSTFADVSADRRRCHAHARPAARPATVTAS